MVTSLVSDEVFAYFIVFVRLGTALMLLPTMGEPGVPPRARLGFAFAFTLVLTPLLRESLPANPSGPIALTVLIAGESLIGLFLGTCARLMMAVMHTAGMVISFQSGLSAAQMFDPNQSAQSSITGNFLNLMALLVIFTSGLHHVLLAGLVDSYTLFPPGHVLPLGDGALMVARVVADSFRVGLQIATPVVVGGFLLYLGAGLLNRLMPQMMVFFVVLPIQIMFAFGLLMVSLSAAIYWFITFFDETWLSLTTPG